MNPMDVLAPNIMDPALQNRGIEAISANLGLGVPETVQANPDAKREAEDESNPVMTKLRRAKARETGTTMETFNAR